MGCKHIHIHIHIYCCTSHWLQCVQCTLKWWCVLIFLWNGFAVSASTLGNGGQLINIFRSKIISRFLFISWYKLDCTKVSALDKTASAFFFWLACLWFFVWKLNQITVFECHSMAYFQEYLNEFLSPLGWKCSTYSHGVHRCVYSNDYKKFHTLELLHKYEVQNQMNVYLH